MLSLKLKERPYTNPAIKNPTYPTLVRSYGGGYCHIVEMTAAQRGWVWPDPGYTGAHDDRLDIINCFKQLL